jgi:serine/threonine protein kinase
MAPELTYPSKFGLPYSQLSKEGDIYALGMVVYEIVMGIRPFGVEGFRVEEVMYVVLDGARPARPGDPEDVGFGPGVWNLVEACWGEDRTQRPNIRGVHQCLAAAADLSPLVPPGPMIVVSPTREISTGSFSPTSQSRWFTPFFTPSQLTCSTVHLFESGHGDENGGNDRETTGSILERSMSVARQVVDSIHASIPPTVRDKFGMFDRRYLRDFVDTFRTRFNFGSLRTPRPRRN